MHEKFNSGIRGVLALTGTSLPGLQIKEQQGLFIAHTC